MKLAVLPMLVMGAAAGQTASAESRAAKPQATLSKTMAADEPKPLLAEIELRPSWNSTDGRFFTYDSAEVGYQTKKLRISYQQQLFTEIAQYGDKTDRPPVRTYDGFFRLRFSDVWKHERTALTYESRVFVPTDANKRDNGMIVQWHNHFKFTHAISSAVTMIFDENPVLHAYSDGSAVEGSTGNSPAKLVANPLIENQMTLEFDWAISKTKLTLSVPLFYSAKRFRDDDDRAENNGSWTHWMEVYPELDYALDKHLTFGIAYESGNLIKLQTDADPTKAPELTSGTVQLILRSRL